MLKTPRLLLRPLCKKDAFRIRELAGAYEVADTTLTIPHPYPVKLAEEWIARSARNWEQGKEAVFAVVPHKHQCFCGSVGLVIQKENFHAEMGFWIGVPYWNRGYCTEAARAVLAFAFEQLKLHRVYALHFARNPASGRVMQKMGMKYEGHLRQHLRKGDHFEDLVCYGILKTEWSALSA